MSGSPAGRWRAAGTRASVAGRLFGPGLEDGSQAVAEAGEAVAAGRTARPPAGPCGHAPEGLADGVGGEPGVGPRRPPRGVGLSVRIDQPTDVLFQFGAVRFGLVTAAVGERIAAAEAGSEFVMFSPQHELEVSEAAMKANMARLMQKG